MLSTGYTNPRPKKCSQTRFTAAAAKNGFSPRVTHLATIARLLGPASQSGTEPSRNLASTTISVSGIFSCRRLLLSSAAAPGTAAFSNPVKNAANDQNSSRFQCEKG